MWSAWMCLRRRSSRSETRFDPFQEFEGLDDPFIRVLAGLVIAQGGLSPVAGVGKAARAGESNCSVGAWLAGTEAILHGFAIADRFPVLTEGRIDLTSFAIDVPKQGVSGRKLCDG